MRWTRYRGSLAMFALALLLLTMFPGSNSRAAGNNPPPAPSADGAQAAPPHAAVNQPTAPASPKQAAPIIQPGLPQSLPYSPPVTPGPALHLPGHWVNSNNVIDLSHTNVFAHPYSPEQVSGLGGAYMDFEPKAVPANTNLVGAFVSSGWLPGEQINIYINGGYAATFASDGYGLMFIYLNSGGGSGTIYIKLIGQSSGRIAGDSLYQDASSTFPRHPAVAIAPHAARPGGIVAFYGVNYPASSAITLTRQFSTISSGNASSDGRFQYVTQVPNTSDGPSVYGAYGNASGTAQGQSVEERADAGPQGELTLARVHSDRGTLPLGSIVYFHHMLMGFAPSETISVTINGAFYTSFAVQTNGSTAALWQAVNPGDQSLYNFVYTGMSSGRKAYAQNIFLSNGNTVPTLLVTPDIASSGANHLVIGSNYPPSSSGNLYLDNTLVALASTNSDGVLITSLNTAANAALDVHGVSFFITATGNLSDSVASSGLITLGPLTSTATLTGRVSDISNNAPLSSTISLSPTLQGQTSPSAIGYYTITAIPAGTYTLTVNSGGCYNPLTQTVNVGGGITTTLNFSMTRSAPDAAGYSCYEGSGRAYQPAANLIPGSQGADDDSYLYTITVPITYYGQTYYTGTINMNGWLSVGSFDPPGGDTYANNCLPDPINPFGLVAANWDDLIYDSVYTDTGIYTSVVGTAPNRTFIVEWRHIRQYNESNYNLDSTIEAQIDEGTGDIYFVYPLLQGASNGDNSTTGIQNYNATIAKQQHCNPINPGLSPMPSYLYSGSSLRFSSGYTPPPTPTPTATPSATATASNTATPSPTATSTATPSPTATSTTTPSPTSTPIPTSTATSTAVPPTSTATSTAVPPTSTPTSTVVPPSSTPTSTAVPPTSTPTSTAVLATDTPTNTLTDTPAPPSATPTSTGTVTPAPTNTAITTPAPTNTPSGPTDTPISTNTPAGPTDTPVATLTNTPAPSATPTDCPNPFVDITGNVFYGAIHYLNCRHVVGGLDATHYGPAGTSTRGQFAKVVVLGFGTPFYTPSGGQDFSDVPPTYFAYLYIESGFHAAVLSGFDQASCQAAGQPYPCYLPNRAITRGQLTKLVVNAAQYPLYTPTGGIQTFSDVPPTNVFFISIETAHQKGVVGGYADHTFRPNNNIRRDEMAQIVYKGVTTP